MQSQKKKKTTTCCCCSLGMWSIQAFFLKGVAVLSRKHRFGWPKSTIRNCFFFCVLLSVKTKTKVSRNRKKTKHKKKKDYKKYIHVYYINLYTHIQQREALFFSTHNVRFFFQFFHCQWKVLFIVFVLICFVIIFVCVWG